jgi:hypothetical protein
MHYILITLMIMIFLVVKCSSVENAIRLNVLLSFDKNKVEF